MKENKKNNKFLKYIVLFPIKIYTKYYYLFLFYPNILRQLGTYGNLYGDQVA